MDTRSEVKTFLSSRRARITPEQAGLTKSGRRRVRGLRREEVAVLAGVSASYDTRLERGEVHTVSKRVLEAVARVLAANTLGQALYCELVCQPAARER